MRSERGTRAFQALIKSLLVGEMLQLLHQVSHYLERERRRSGREGGNEASEETGEGPVGCDHRKEGRERKGGHRGFGGKGREGGKREGRREGVREGGWAHALSSV
jgi:hypothetical protein